jgi:hypothetical protein
MRGYGFLNGSKISKYVGGKKKIKIMFTELLFIAVSLFIKLKQR